MNEASNPYQKYQDSAPFGSKLNQQTDREAMVRKLMEVFSNNPDATMGAVADELLSMGFTRAGSDILTKLLAALGWQRGTMEQVVAEVARLKAQDDAIKVKAQREESHSQDHPGWKSGKSVAEPRFGGLVGPMLGQGVVAVSEVKKEGDHE